MIDDHVRGPWAGMYRRPIPISLKRRRNRFRAIFVTLAIMAMIFGGLMALSH